MFRYKLRTLLILLALGPPMIAGAWLAIERYRAWRHREVWEDVAGPGTIFSFEVTYDQCFPIGTEEPGDELCAECP